MRTSARRRSPLLALGAIATALAGVTVATPADAAVNPTIDSIIYSVDATHHTAAALDVSGKQTPIPADLTIPSSIQHEGQTYTVTEIGAQAFLTDANNPTTLTSVTIPSSVTTIGGLAFFQQSFTSLVIPDSVTSIGDNAFGNNPLTSLTLGTGLTSIGESAFSNNTSLTAVTIPAGVTSIGTYAFAGDALTSLTIPDNVTTVGPGAFQHNQISSLSLGSGLTAIANAVFFANELTSVSIPSGVTSIGNQAFYGNELTSVTIPSGVTTIGSQAFRANALTNVTIPNAVTEAGYAAFQDNDITSATLGSGLTAVADYLFADNGLTSITIPDGITSIGANAFNGNALTAVMLPDGVTSIGQAAFYDNDLAPTLTIPAAVTSIGANAFAANSRITNVLLLGPAPDATDSSFGSDPQRPALHFVTKYGAPGTPGGYTSPTWHGYPSSSLDPTPTQPTPTITGTAREGKTLRAHTTSDQDVSWQWFANGTEIAGATSSRLTLHKSQAARRITVRAAFGTESATSKKTRVVASSKARVVLSPGRLVLPGEAFRVTATGLKARQKVTIVLDGRTAYAGKADSHGNVDRSVSFRSSTKVGERSVRVRGYDAKGKRTYSIKTTATVVTS